MDKSHPETPDVFDQPESLSEEGTFLRPHPTVEDERWRVSSEAPAAIRLVDTADRTEVLTYIEAQKAAIRESAASISARALQRRVTR